MKVLIVDDDLDGAEGLVALLTATGHDVRLEVGARADADAVATWGPHATSGPRTEAVSISRRPLRNRALPRRRPGLMSVH